MGSIVYKTAFSNAYEVVEVAAGQLHVLPLKEHLIKEFQEVSTVEQLQLYHAESGSELMDHDYLVPGSLVVGHCRSSTSTITLVDGVLYRLPKTREFHLAPLESYSITGGDLFKKIKEDNKIPIHVSHNWRMYHFIDNKECNDADYIMSTAIVIIRDLLDHEAVETPRALDKVQVGYGPSYSIAKELGRGGFGQVFCGQLVNGTSASGAAKVALKFEKRSKEGPPFEWQAYNMLGGISGVPHVHHKGRQEDYYIMVMDMLRLSLCEFYTNIKKKRMLLEEVADIAACTIAILEKVHSRGLVHGDLKPANLLFGCEGTSEEKNLHLVDYGLATRWLDPSSGRHVPYSRAQGRFRGTVAYASCNVHRGERISRRDDMISLAYMSIYLLEGSLPWDVDGAARDKVYLKKLDTSSKSLCRLNADFVGFVDYVTKLGFYETPDYQKWISKFQIVKARERKAREARENQ